MGGGGGGGGGGVGTLNAKQLVNADKQTGLKNTVLNNKAGGQVVPFEPR